MASRRLGNQATGERGVRIIAHRRWNETYPLLSRFPTRIPPELPQTDGQERPVFYLGRREERCLRLIFLSKP